MALTVETGAGIAGSEAYSTVAAKDTYWAARTQLALSATWTAATTAKKEGASREAAAYIDATWGSYFKGVRRGFIQGLLWPRTGALDDAGYPLPDLPACLQAAEAELAARALSAPLAADIDAAARVKSEKVGPIETDYFDAGSPAPGTSYGVIAGLLAPVLNGSQPMAPNAAWSWA